MAQFLDKVSLAADAANTISEFVACEQIRTLPDVRKALSCVPARGKDLSVRGNNSSVGVIVLCASAVLSTTEIVLSFVQELTDSHARSSSLNGQSIVLVLCGGIGHSTQLMHGAVQRHPQYCQIAEELEGKPEARILQAVCEQFFHLKVDSIGDEPRLSGQGQSLTILVEDESTNCWLNAKQTRELLDSHGFTTPRIMLIAQDPTMCRRTVAAFEHVYADNGVNHPTFKSWPTFVPRVMVKEHPAGAKDADIPSRLCYAVSGKNDEFHNGLWSMDRFLSLLLGEIPRMRDDENGYGPKGKGNISHVDIPQDVEDAWSRLDQIPGLSIR